MVVLLLIIIIMLENCITTTVGKIFSLIHRQHVLNIRNLFDPRNASVAGLC